MNTGNTRSGAVRSLGLASVLLAISGPVLAHHPLGGMTPETWSQGLLSGLGHPIIGVDHLAFLLLAAALITVVQGAARWWMPLAFVGATFLGTFLHLGALEMPLAESLIAATVLLGGVFLGLRLSLGTRVLVLALALSGLLHGYAYGEAVIGAEATPILAYLLGIAAIQYAVMLGFQWGMDRLGQYFPNVHHHLYRAIGGVGTLLGGWFLALSFA